MPYTVQLIATGMVTFRPAAVVYPNKIPSLTFVMMDNPTRRKSVNYPDQEIAKHSAFLMVEQRNVVTGDAWRPVDLPPNQFRFGGWLLDKERLSLAADPKTQVTFDSSIGEIASIGTINPALAMEPLYASINPPTPGPVGGQFFVESGNVWAEGKPVKVRFHPSGGTPGPEVMIRNEVYVEIDLPDKVFTIQSRELGGTNMPLAPIRLEFASGQSRMKVYFGSAPLPVLQQLPLGSASATHLQDVDFELYYDITRGGPPSQRPIPHREGSGPVPGSERCPPLHNQ